MGTQPSGLISATKVSFWQKLESFFHKEVVVIETDIKALLDSPDVVKLEEGFTALCKSDLGKLAVEAVTVALSVETGHVSFPAAAATLISSAKALGKTLTDSTVTTLIAAAQQKLQSYADIQTTPTA